MLVYLPAGREDALLDEGYMGDSDDGIITRSLMYLYEQLGSTGGTGRGGDGCRYSLRASFAEIYNEQIFDLVRFDEKQLQVGSCCRRGWYWLPPCAALCVGQAADWLACFLAWLAGTWLLSCMAALPTSHCLPAAAVFPNAGSVGH